MRPGHHAPIVCKPGETNYNGPFVLGSLSRPAVSRRKAHFPSVAVATPDFFFQGFIMSSASDTQTEHRLWTMPHSAHLKVRLRLLRQPARSSRRPQHNIMHVLSSGAAAATNVNSTPAAIVVAPAVTATTPSPSLVQLAAMFAAFAAANPGAGTSSLLSLPQATPTLTRTYAAPAWPP